MSDRGPGATNEHLRYARGYRPLFTTAIPRYTINEIDPAFSKVPAEAMVDDNLTIFDVGANHGVWSAALLMHSGKFVKQLHLFEPLPGNLDQIAAHQRRGLYRGYVDKLVVNPVAVSDEPGRVEIRWDTERSGYASAAVSETLMGERRIALDHVSEIQAVSLDVYCERNGIEHIDLLKVDVEGFEMAVFEGARRLLADKRIGVILYEFGTHQMARREYYRDFYEFFAGLGYRNWRLRPNGWAPAPVDSYTTIMENFSQVMALLATRE